MKTGGTFRIVAFRSARGRCWGCFGAGLKKGGGGHYKVRSRDAPAFMNAGVVVALPLQTELHTLPSDLDYPGAIGVHL